MFVQPSYCEEPEPCDATNANKRTPMADAARPNPASAKEADTRNATQPPAATTRARTPMTRRAGESDQSVANSDSGGCSSGAETSLRAASLAARAARIALPDAAAGNLHKVHCSCVAAFEAPQAWQLQA
jgi:hypothetical protein